MFLLLSLIRSYLFLQGLTYYLDIIPEEALTQAIEDFRDPLASEGANNALPELLEALDI